MVCNFPVVDAATAAVTTRPPKLWPTRCIRCTRAASRSSMGPTPLANYAGKLLHLVVGEVIQEPYRAGLDAGENIAQPRRTKKLLRSSIPGVLLPATAVDEYSLLIVRQGQADT
jgi:hypothetical protein